MNGSETTCSRCRLPFLQHYITFRRVLGWYFWTTRRDLTHREPCAQRSLARAAMLFVVCCSYSRVEDITLTFPPENVLRLPSSPLPSNNNCDIVGVSDNCCNEYAFWMSMKPTHAYSRFPLRRQWFLYSLRRGKAPSKLCDGYIQCCIVIYLPLSPASLYIVKPTLCIFQSTAWLVALPSPPPSSGPLRVDSR